MGPGVRRGDIVVARLPPLVIPANAGIHWLSRYGVAIDSLWLRPAHWTGVGL